MRHPAFECFGFRFPASENQGIEARPADNRHFLIAARGVDNIYSPFIFIQTFIQCVTAVLDFQDVADIFGNPSLVTIRIGVFL